MKLTHRHIEVFRAVMEAHSVTAAAVVIGTSQPTLSRQLSELEALLGYKLFLRVGRRLVPTASALALHDEIQKSFLGLDHIIATAIAIGKFVEGQISVICAPCFAHALMPQACRRFREGHRGVGISLVPQELPMLDEWLTAQRFDLGLLQTEELPPGTHQRAVFRFEEVCLLPPGHHLLAKTVLQPADFQDEDFVGQALTDPTRMQLDEIFRLHGVNRRMAIEAHDATAIGCLVRAGLGVAIINPLTALNFMTGGVELRPFTPAVTSCLNIVCPDYRPFSPLAECFVASVQAEIAAMAARLRQAGGSRAAV